MGLTFGEVVIDCGDPRSLAAFWREMTGYQLAHESDRWVALDPGNDGVVIAFQRVPETKSVKNRVHLDLYTADVESEVARCLELGARKLWDSTDPDDVFVTLADPEGNEFCVCLES